MTAPTILIAEREFRAYTATASFWAALGLAPIIMAVVLALTGLSAAEPTPPQAVFIGASDPGLGRTVTAAFVEAAGLEGRRVAVSPRAAGRPQIVATRSASGDVSVVFSGDLALSASGRALIARTIERDEDANRLPAKMVGSKAVVVNSGGASASSGPDPGVLTRFSLVMILWVTLTGSLGMLLQAVVRERANRALEGLLAAVRPWEIVLGKLTGVGLVSAVLLVAWLGSAFGLSLMSPRSGGFISAVIGGLGDPAMLARSAAIYVLAFMFYGLVTVGLGAGARDSAAAQNLSRPMFAVLLAAFFVAVAAVPSGGQLGWLVYLPPFSPFLLLLRAPAALPILTQVLAVAFTLAATIVAGWFALKRVTLSGAVDRPGQMPASQRVKPPVDALA